MIQLTRRYHFSASHRLHSPAFSEEMNRETFGKCANPFGHGHNYALEITVKGPVDEHGRVVSIPDLDQVVHDKVVNALDHHDLNAEVPEFSGALIPTTENLAAVVRDRLLVAWPNGFPKLDRIRIYETRKNTFEIRNI